MCQCSKVRKILDLCGSSLLFDFANHKGCMVIFDFA